VHRSTLIPAVLAVLVLAACSKEDKPAAPTTGAGNAAAAGADVWPAVGPLLAGSHTGSCTRTPQLDTAEATISLDAAGKLTAPDISADMRKAQMISLTRETAGGTVKAGAMLSMDAEKGPVLTLSDEGKPDGAGAALMRGEQMISCPKGPPLDKLRSQPLYKSMARFVDSPGVAVTCVSRANPLEQKKAEFKLTGGMATLGVETFDLSRAETETLMIIPAENQVLYSFKLPGGPLMQVGYDLSGKLVALQDGGESGLTRGCQVES